MNQPARQTSAAETQEHLLRRRFYNEHSHTQGKANSYALPLISKAIGHIEIWTWR